MRRDLELYPGPAGAEGAPSWTLFDPLRQRFFRLGWVEGVILSQWGIGTKEAVEKAAAKVAGAVVTGARVEEVGQFLATNELLQSVERLTIKQLIIRSQARKRGFWLWLFHNYLFIKIPLFHPDRFLTATLPMARWLVSRGFLILLTIVGVVGIYLTVRQWDGFIHALPDAPTPTGAVMLAMAVLLAKLMHELGHAYAACHYGCRVPSMGMALIVLWPVLYADTSETWKLASHRARLQVGVAGVGAELTLALVATFLWHFPAPGPWRDALALLAAVSWISTLAVNLNPCMRFDGYYLLADWVAIPNLGPRAFALAGWRLREWLFGLGLAPPERWSVGKRRFMLLFAYVTWCYRLVVFVGIALLVYHAFFKLAGIVLMVAEIGWFVLWPVGRFIYKTPFSAVSKGRLVKLAGMLAGLVLLLVVPWRQSVEVPALLVSSEHVRLFSPVAARVKEVFVGAGDQVKNGERLLVLESPELEQALLATEARIRILALEADQLAARPVVLAMRLTLEQRLLEAKAEKAGLVLQSALLTITAPFAGEVTGVQEGLVAGRWVSRTTILMELMNPNQPLVEAWVPEADIQRLTLGVSALFLPVHNQSEPVPVRLTRLDASAVSRLTRGHLASTHGGSIVAKSDGQGGMVPAEAWYQAILTPIAPTVGIFSTLPGTVQIPARQQSLFDRIWTAMAALWIRESGF